VVLVGFVWVDSVGIVGVVWVDSFGFCGCS
jgi:hypothetical protein